MIGTPDIRTLVLVLPIGHAIAAFVLFFSTRNRDRLYDTLFMISMALQAAGWLLLLFRGQIPDFVSFSIANTLIFCGFCLEGLALLSLVRTVDRRWTRFYAAALAVAVIAAWLPLPGENLAVAIMSFVVPLFFIFPGWFLIFSAPRPSPLQKFIGVTILLYVAAVLARGVYILAAGSYSLLEPTAFQILFVLLQIAMMVLAWTGYILISREFAYADLATDNAERNRVEKELVRKTHDLGERMKELRCLYDVARLIETAPSDDALFSQLADELPAGWQYPDLTSARIVVEGKEFVSAGFRTGPFRQESAIVVYGKPAGRIEFFYHGEVLPPQQDPFLPEEALLIHAIAERIGRMLERKGAEAALRESEEKYRTLFEQSNDAIIIADTATHQIADCNHRAGELTGYSRSELLALHMDDLHPEDVRAQTRSQVRAFTRGATTSIETDILTRGGGRIPVSLNAWPADINKVPCLIAIFRDITWQKEVQKKILEKTEEMDLYFNTSIDLFCIADADGYFRRLNPEWEKTLGWPVAELEGKRFLDYVHPDDLAATLSVLKDLSGQARVNNFVNRYRHRDGTYRWIEWRSVPSGNRIYAAARDITQRRQMEEALRQSGERFRNTIANVPLGMHFYELVPDRGLVFTGANPAADQILKVSHDRFVGKTIEEAFPALAGTEIPGRYREVARTGRTWQTEQVTYHEGSISGAFTVTAFQTEPGTMVAMFEDITGRKQMEEALRESEEKFRAIFNSTFQFTGLLTPDGVLTEVNDTALAFTGLPREEVIDRPFWDSPWWRGDEQREQRLKDAIREAAAGNFVRYEVMVQGSGSTNLWVDFSLKPVVDADGAVRLLIPEARDITDRKKIEEALTIEKQFSDTIIDSIPGIFYFLDERGSILRTNRNNKLVLGYGDDELQGMNALLTIAPEDRAVVDANISSVFRQGYISVTARILTKDGRKIPYILTGFAMHAGGKRFLVGTGIDITEQVRAQEALRESEEKYRAIIENLQDMVYRTDLNGIFTMVSPSGARLIGLASPDQLVGRPVAEHYLHPDDRFAFLAALQKNGSVENYPVTLKAVDGTIRHVLVNSHLYYDSAGTVQGVEGVIHDITSLRLTEQALKESEQKLRAILDNIQDMVYRVDFEGKFLMISPSGVRMFGYESMEEMIGTPVTDLYVNPGDRRVFLEDLRKTGSVYGYPLALKARDGSVIHVAASSHFFYDADGKVAGVEGILHDVTGLRKAEEAIRVANRKLNLLSSITRHDIRNQLLALTGYLQLSRDAIQDPEKISGLLDKVTRIAGNIGSQISFTKDYEDLGVKAPAWQDVSLLVRDIATALPMQDIRLEIDCPGLEIYADPLLRKVFYNLIDNSLHYGGEKMTAIRLAARQEGETLRIVVGDDGAGISAADKTKLFTKGFGKHTGLGLFLSREILAITGITITENGEPGRGARFEMVVPAGGFRFTGDTAPA